MRPRTTAALFAGALLALACGSEEDEPRRALSRAELLDPETCRDCHADHYREWSGSMHAYAAEDPVFRAMNERGQRETNGALGDFCVSCHAPMAVREGATTDGLNLDEVSDSLEGVTCYFCHNVQSVGGTHNNPLELFDDDTMYGPLSDPAESSPHRAAYSANADISTRESSDTCGACHDIVLPSPPAPAAVHLERTFSEWQGGLFAKPAADGGLSCGTCHMPGRNDVAADADGVVQRRVNSHEFPAVDVALTPFPQMERQRELVQQELDNTLRSEICVLEQPGGASLDVLLDNVGAGHNFPSGAAHDRRLWVQVVAFAGTTRVYESGVVPDGTAVTDTAATDPDLWLLRDEVFKANDDVAHMFWDIARLEARTVPGPVTSDTTDPDFFVTHVSRRFPRDGSTIAGAIDRVAVTLKLRPMGLDVLDDLVDSGDLDASVRDAMPTFDMSARGAGGTTLEWTPEAAADPDTGFTKTFQGVAARCVASAPGVR